jgi:hypothetical protein
MTGNLATCVPQCSALTYGFLLSISIDGRGTVLNCNNIDGKFSWQGQASLGGYIGADILSLVSSIVSGAAGTFLGTVTEDAGVLVDLAIKPAQLVLLVGLRSLVAAPAWGSGSFTVQERGSLTLEYIRLEGAITLQPGATALTLNSCENVNAVVSNGLEVPSGTTVRIEAVAPTSVSLGVAPMAGILMLLGQIELSNTNILTIASTAFGGASVSVQDGVTITLPDRSRPGITGALPGMLTTDLDGQTIGTISSDGTTVSSSPIGWWQADDATFWDSGSVTNANGYTFALYLLPLQPPSSFGSGSL